MKSTSDIYLAAFLIVNDMYPDGYRVDKRFVVFEYDDDDEFADFAGKYVNGGTVIAMDFADALKEVKGMIRDAGIRE